MVCSFGHASFAGLHVRGFYGEPLRLLDRALRAAKSLGNQGDVGVHLGNLGLVYPDMGELLKALEHHQQARAIFEAIGMPREAEIVRGNIAELQEQA